MSPRGFTLFELLVVLVIVGTLATLAMPAYRQHVMRVNRTEAMTLLLHLQGAEESHYLRHDAYTANIEAPPPEGLGIPASSTTNKYSIEVALAADGQSYIATASPVGSQAEDRDCLALSLDARGRRAVSGTAGVQRCWK